MVTSASTVAEPTISEVGLETVTGPEEIKADTLISEVGDIVLVGSTTVELLPTILILT